MITAVDSCVILDILTNDPDFADRSIAAFRQAREEGRIIVSEFVVAEITPVVGEGIDLFMADLGLEYVGCGIDQAKAAGRGFGLYLQRGGKRGRVIADFLIGEHARHHSDRLLTRDRGFQRDYFADLPIWYP